MFDRSAFPLDPFHGFGQGVNGAEMFGRTLLPSEW